jgi:hypothetical protein
MPRKHKNKKKAGSNRSSNDQMVRMTGPNGFKLDFPWPRLPSWIGTPNLRANRSVYPRVDLDVPILVTSSAIVTGAIAAVINIDASQIFGFATRFGSLFQEFAIVGARFEIRVSTAAAAQGMLLAFIDENSAATPTAAQALNRPHCEIPLTSSQVDSTGSLHIVEWKAHSYADLTWDAVSTVGNVGYLKLFANIAQTGTQASTAADVLISGAFAICFRGYI